MKACYIGALMLGLPLLVGFVWVIYLATWNWLQGFKEFDIGIAVTIAIVAYILIAGKLLSSCP